MASYKILDGAMGTMVQSFKLSESEFRGNRFQDHTHDLQGNNDILCLTQPEIVQKIHEAYFKERLAPLTKEMAKLKTKLKDKSNKDNHQ